MNPGIPNVSWVLTLIIMMLAISEDQIDAIGYESDFNSPYTLTDALLREVVAKMGEDDLLQLPLGRRVTKDDDEQEHRLSDADYEALMDPQETMIRDQEYLQHSSLWGHQYVAGGAGEGKQRLKPDGSISNVHEVKTDSVLPAYCDPPNPCPVGYTGDDDCLENFINSADYSREYQSSQDCMCDTEHMFDCPTTSRQDEINALAQSIQNEGLSDQALDKIMENLQGRHKSLVAKKHNNPAQMGYLRNLRSMSHKQRKPSNENDNPYLKGEKLPIVAKKGSNIIIFFVTCGSDGDVRVWKDLEDDDPKSHRVGESAYAVVVGVGHFYVSTDTNSVLSYTLPDAGPDGVVSRASSLFNHLDLSGDGKKLLVGGSDFSIKLVDVDDKSFKVFLGHDAPVLTVVLDPLSEYAVSSSCDGSVRIWKLAKQNCVKSWAAVFTSSNELSASKVLCRLSWQPFSGKLLGIPVGNSVKLYRRDTWDDEFTLKEDSFKECVNCVAFSRCGHFVAAGYVDGSILAWHIESKRCLEKQKPDKGYPICSLEWHPNRKEIVFCDIQGRVGMVEIFLLDNDIESPAITGNSSISVARHAFNEDDGNYIDDVEDDDENTFSISKIKAETLGLENGREDTVDTQKAAQLSAKVIHNFVAQPRGPQLAEPQEAFQPGSTPTYYSHRFMVWNSIGIILSYNTDDESSIDIQFHDTSVHHSMHLENSLGHTIADLSTSAVVLGCVAQPPDVPSKLVCVHFATWDSTKEWTVDMPDNESILIVAASCDWIAAATDQRHLRIFSIGGVEKRIVELPGPVVSMAAAAQNNLLIVAYHRAIGYPGDQCLGLMLVDLSSDAVVANTHDLPLSAKSTLAWLGFTDEETPCTADSNGVIRLLSTKVNIGLSAWMQIADTKSQTKGRSDHHFVVGLSETQQHIRCIPCKASKYPATLPHPTITVLPFRLPLCEIQSEKGQLLETFMKKRLLLETVSRLKELGYETDEAGLEASRKTSRETLIKLFALSCRSGHEFRSVELAELMDSSHTVQLAIKYASQVKRFQLAERLGQVAYAKMEAESKPVQRMKETAEADDDVEVPEHPQQQRLMQNELRSRQAVNRMTKHAYDENSNMEEVADEIEESQESETQISTQSSVKSSGPMTVPGANYQRTNPFIVSTFSSNAKTNNATSGGVVGNSGDSKGIHLIDNLTKKSLERPSVPTASTGAIRKSGSGLKPKSRTVKTNVSGDISADSVAAKSKSGVHMWLSTKVDNQDAGHKKSIENARRNSGEELTSIASIDDDPNNKQDIEKSKRKRGNEIDDDPANVQRPSKLSAFTFNK